MNDRGRFVVSGSAFHFDENNKVEVFEKAKQYAAICKKPVTTEILVEVFQSHRRYKKVV